MRDVRARWVMAEPRLFRVIVLGGASLVGSATLAVICGKCGGPDETSDSGCPSSIQFVSYCGFSNITTTCSGGPARCNPSGSATVCSIGPVTSNCSVSVVLADGTAKTFPVTLVLGCVSPPGPLFMCPLPDAATDATSDANDDASTDAPSDAQDAGGDS